MRPAPGSVPLDRVRPVVSPVTPCQIGQETELLTFPAVVTGPVAYNALLKKSIPNNRSRRSHAPYRNRHRNPIILTLKYFFILLSISSGIISLHDIYKLQLSPQEEQFIVNSNTVIHNNNNSNNNINNTNTSVNQVALAALTTKSDLLHEMRTPLVCNVAVSLTALFMAIFDQSIEHYLTPLGFGLVILLELIAMIITMLASRTNLKFEQKYSWYLWVIYAVHSVFCFTFMLVILTLKNRIDR